MYIIQRLIFGQLDKGRKMTKERKRLKYENNIRIKLRERESSR